MFSAEFWFKAFELILALSILVFVHELGHFMWARLFKVGVEKFYLFFDAYNFAFLRWNKEGLHICETIHFPRFKNPSDTEYGIGWIPLGGYCAIVGMVDETHDAEHAEVDRPDAFAKANKFKQFMIMVGGVLNNVLFACLLYVCIVWVWGSDIVEQKNLPNGIYFNEYAHQIGFEDTDLIVAVDGDPIRDLNEFHKSLLLANNVTVNRDGKDLTIQLPDTMGTYFLAHKSEFESFFNLNIPFVIGEVMADGPAGNSGLQTDDHIVAIGVVQDTLPVQFVSTPYIHQVKEMLAKNASQTVCIQYQRGDSVLVAENVTLSDKGTLGVTYSPLADPAWVTHIDYGFVEAIPAGISKGWNTLVDYVRQFKLVFSKEGAKEVGGFGTMGSIMPEEWNWLRFWGLTAFFSIALAFMNILPIPALDGGHIMILVIEAIIRRPLSEKLKERLQMIGFVFILLLMVAVNLNDIIKLFS